MLLPQRLGSLALESLGPLGHLHAFTIVRKTDLTQDGHIFSYWPQGPQLWAVPLHSALGFCFFGFWRLPIVWPLISGLWSTWANINRRKKSLHKIAFLLYKNDFFQDAVCKKKICLLAPYFFAVFFRGKSPPLEGRVVVTWELNAVRKIFFWAYST